VCAVYSPWKTYGRLSEVGALPAFSCEEIMNETALWDSLERYLAAEGLRLDDVEWSGRVLRVLIDADGGIDVGRISDAASGISRLIDGETDVQGPYTLEVSSPGLERTLRRPGQFRASLGREVVITSRFEGGDTATVRGTLDAADDDVCVVAEGDHVATIPLSEIVSAKTVFQWERGAKPGKQRKEASR
jgi:ribosome maturation factor RimP